ncbi:ATP-binding protein [Actinoplanes sp. NPDC048796]|uniref:ATP-binding protein n=1 Tax=Actinoplanes sp. NPDC048796 TaxID=3155640 RepID=UPI0034071153
MASVITGDGARAAPLTKPYLLTTLTDRRGVAVAVTGDATTAVVEMAVHGEWSTRFGDQIATCLRLCLAGPSVTAIIDLHDLEDPLGLSMPFWMAAWRRARFDTSPVDLVLCVPGASALGRRLRAAEGPQLFAVPAQARPAVAAQVSQADRLQARLASRPHCIRAARDLARQACNAWNLHHLVQDTALTMSELATNAVEHARTDFVVTVSRQARRLHVAVQDGAPQFPRLRRPDPPGPAASPGGRGLVMVDRIAAAWGAMPTRGGKVVWATLE